MDKNNKKVGIFVPCCIDQFAPRCAFKAMHLIEKLGFECYYPEELTCCGKELYNQGDKNGAKLLGEKMIEMYDDCQYVVSLSSACVAYIQNHFGSLFHNTMLHNSYRQMVDKCLDLSDFLVNIVHFTPTSPYPHRVAYMDHCTTLRDYHCLAHTELAGLYNEPRQLLDAVPQLQRVEMSQNDVCCGLGGLFANHFTPVANSLSQRKVENAIATGAEILTSTEPSCLMHLQAYINKSGIKLECANMIDILMPDEV